MTFLHSASQGGVSSEIFRVVAAFGLVVFLAGCGTDDPVLLGGETMGTTWSVAIADPLSEQRRAELRKETEALLLGVNQSMSNWLEDSEVSRINSSRSVDWQSVSPGLATVLATALQTYRFSGGYFDITVSPLVRLWGFGPGGRKDVLPPSEQEIQAVLPEVGSGKLQLRMQPPALRKNKPKLQLDLSAIAKGYAVDVLSEHLHSAGLDNFMVEIGGDLRVSGRNQEGAAWRIGLEKPVADERAVSLAIALESGGVASSGGYRNFVGVNGVRYPHGIDPHTGRPIKHHTIMVTVVADTATRADALATAFYVLGSERSLALAAREKVAAAFFLQENEEIRPVFSNAFKPLLVQ